MHASLIYNLTALNLHANPPKRKRGGRIVDDLNFKSGKGKGGMQMILIFKAGGETERQREGGRRRDREKEREINKNEGRCRLHRF